MPFEVSISSAFGKCTQLHWEQVIEYFRLKFIFPYGIQIPKDREGLFQTN